ncbi:MAG: hypothetical protein ABR588_12250 [Sphingomicrobium sp.]|nr:hypothetical protein [Sphingomonadales bacterium]
MKMLLAMFLLLFTVTAAFPAAAARSTCDVTASQMAGMAMAPEQHHSKGSCCDLDNACAQACDALCAPSAIAPLIRAAESTPPLRVEAVASSHPQLASLNFASIDPPPKTAG